MADSSRFIFAVVVATILVLAMVGVMGLLMVVNTNRRHRHRADLAEADLRREREVLRAEREATEHTLVEVGREHPLRFVDEPDTGGLKPYVVVRGRLEAKLTRAVFYELADMAVAHEGRAGVLGIWSQGEFFELGPVA